MTLSTRTGAARSAPGWWTRFFGDRSGQAHLGELEFVDLLDGTLDGSRMEHASACPACRAKANDLSVAVREAADIEVPEPSPLYWDQLSARVRTAIADEPQPRRSMWRALQPTAIRWAALATTALLVFAVGLWRIADPDRTLPDSPAGNALRQPAGGDTLEIPGDDPFGDIASDEDWTLVQTVAEDVPLDEIQAAGVGLRPGAAEGLALRLSDTERSELARLLEEAIRSRTPSESSS
ncbi:MAG: hypothetical protein ACRD15_11505 [Vicinamibacterales bacterium]